MFTGQRISLLDLGVPQPNDLIVYVDVANMKTKRALVSSFGGGSGGGHTIYVDNITALTQRPNLSFNTFFTVTDDLANNATNVILKNSSIGFNKLQDISTNRLLGRFTAGSGSIEEIIIGSGLTLIGNTLSASGGLSSLVGASLTNGRMIIGNASNLSVEILMSGDATISNTGVLTIANNAVSFSKIQNINTNRLLGRSTAATGVIEEISIGSGLSLSAGILSSTISSLTGVTLTNGRMLIGNASNLSTEILMSGDATISNTGVLTISNGVVSNVKLATVATSTIKGRVTAGTGAVEDLSAIQVNTILGLNIANGRVAYGNASSNGVTSSFRFQFSNAVAGSDGILVYGIGTTTSKSLTLFSSTSGETFSVQDNGIANIVSAIFSANTTTRPSFRITNSSAVNVATPTNGDLWYNGTNLFFRYNATSVDLMSLPNANLAPMVANTIKANATSGTTTPQDIVVNTNSVLGRDGSSNIGNIPLQDSIAGTDVLTSGSCILYDARITTTSYAILTYSTTNNGTGILKYNVNTTGQMTISSTVGTDNAVFSYIIVF